MTSEAENCHARNPTLTFACINMAMFSSQGMLEPEQGRTDPVDSMRS